MELANDHALLLIATQNPLKVVHNGKQKQFKSQTVGQKKLSLDFKAINDGADLALQLWAFGHYGENRYLSLSNTAPNTSFTIEGIASKGRKCYQIDSENLKTYCRGAISVRPDL